jgi:hypothetical protein
MNQRLIERSHLIGKTHTLQCERGLKPKVQKEWRVPIGVLPSIVDGAEGGPEGFESIGFLGFRVT